MNNFQNEIPQYYAYSIYSAVDELLPKVTLDAAQVILAIFGSVILAAVVNPYFLIPLAVMTILFILIGKVFMKTAKKIKRLEGTGKGFITKICREFCKNS